MVAAAAVPIFGVSRMRLRRLLLKVISVAFRPTVATSSNGGSSRGAARNTTAQASIDDAFRQQLVNVSDALIAGPFELLELQTARDVSGVELLGSLACVPLRGKGW